MGIALSKLLGLVNGKLRFYILWRDYSTRIICICLSCTAFQLVSIGEEHFKYKMDSDRLN